jgi:hypothetical protein
VLAAQRAAGAARPRFGKQRRLPLPSDLGKDVGMHLHDVDGTSRRLTGASGPTAYLLRSVAYLSAAGL